MNENDSLKSKLINSLTLCLGIFKAMLFVIAVVVAFKVFLNPGTDGIEVILERLVIACSVVIPLIYIGCYAYTLIHYEEMKSNKLAKKSKV